MNEDVLPFLRILFGDEEQQPTPLQNPITATPTPIANVKYKKVQFISWEIYSGPDNIFSNKFDLYGTPLYDEKYVGLNYNVTDLKLDYYGQCWDIEARIEFTQKAILAAKTKADSSSDVLKIFMGPEFLYRGAAGAYIHDLINGWEMQAPSDFGLSGTPFENKWPGLFGKLKQLVEKDDYKNWLFVFGTAISAKFHTYINDENILVSCPSASIIYNTSLVQLGGVGMQDNCYASQKHYLSHIDLINWYKGQTSVFTMQNSSAAESRSYIPKDDLIIPDGTLGSTEGSAVFNIAGVGDATGKLIDFGIEICLDHLQSGSNSKNDYGRIRTSNQYVKIQLVPSGGAELKEASIRLLPGTSSYAINCDGLGTLTDTYNNQYRGSHTQIWNGATRITNALLEASSGGAITRGSKPSVTVNVPEHITLYGIIITDTALWVEGSGNVRIVEALPL